MTNFSVIIPAYQAAGTVGRAVESALNQTLAPHEVIVCDDGSTDDLDGALAHFRDRILMIRQENRGLSAARNAACQLATGDWLVLLDADDEWLPTRLQRIAECIDQDTTVDIVTTDAWCRAPGRPDVRWYDDRTFPPANERQTAILDWGSIFGGAAIRRSSLERAGWFTVGLPHDSEWEAWVRLIFSGSGAALVPEPLAIYHVHPGPRLSDKRAAHYRMGVEVYESLRGEHGAEIDALLDRLIRREHERLAVAEGVEAIQNGQRSDCLRAALSPALPRGQRWKFLLAALAPRLAARRLANGR